MHIIGATSMSLFRSNQRYKRLELVPLANLEGSAGASWAAGWSAYQTQSYLWNLLKGLLITIASSQHSYTQIMSSFTFSSPLNKSFYLVTSDTFSNKSLNPLFPTVLLLLLTPVSDLIHPDVLGEGVGERGERHKDSLEKMRCIQNRRGLGSQTYFNS